jgi:hypothetical protein
MVKIEGKNKQGEEMEFYHTFLYEKILNAPWFVWSIVIIVFSLNVLGPVIIWFVMNSKPLPLIKKLRKKKKEDPNLKI